jgi:hypothetical protein
MINRLKIGPLRPQGWELTENPVFHEAEVRALHLRTAKISGYLLDGWNGAMSHDQRKGQQVDTNRGNDPIKAVWSQSSSFNAAWLKNGESLSILQRTGFAIFSLLFTAVGLYLVRFAVMFAKQRDFMTLIFGGCSASFLVFGVLGLKNVLRFKRTG